MNILDVLRKDDEPEAAKVADRAVKAWVTVIVITLFLLLFVSSVL